MEKDFSEVMSNRTDEELVKIVTVQRNDYQPEAVIAAEKEIEKRNIDKNKVETLKEEIETKEIESELNENKTVNSFLRLVHYIVDFIMFILLSIIISLIVGVFLSIVENVNLKLVAYFVYIVSFFLYYILMEYKFQKTVGKFITKTKVVKVNGEKPEINDIIIRTLCRLIPFDNISYIFSRNGFHDYLSKTTVIKE